MARRPRGAGATGLWRRGYPLLRRYWADQVQRWGFPIPLEDIARALESCGVRSGDSLLVHSSLREFFRGSPYPRGARYESGEQYAQDLLGLLRKITENGALLLPTEFINDKQQAAFTGQTFDLKEAPSRRGFLTELFRRSEGVKRSTNPIYNVSLLGEGYDRALADHWELPYTMDVGSPWYQFMEAGILFLGVPVDNNSMIHMPEYLLKDAYPRPVFYNHPHAFQLVGTSGKHREVLAHAHAIRWSEGTVTKFCNYLNQKQPIYHKAVVGRAEITVVSAKEQYELLMAELEQGVSWYDAIYWP